MVISKILRRYDEMRVMLPDVHSADADGSSAPDQAVHQPAPELLLSAIPGRSSQQVENPKAHVPQRMATKATPTLARKVPRMQGRLEGWEHNEQ